MTDYQDYALFDLLFTLKRLEDNFINDISVDELLVILYLSAFIGINKGLSYSAWGYKFYLSESRITSKEIIKAIEMAQEMEYIVFSPEEITNVSLTSSGKKTVQFFSKLSVFENRKNSISNSCDICLLSDLSTVLNGIYSNDELNNPDLRSSIKEVLGEVATEHMYKNLINITEQVGLDIRDPILSTLTWVTYNNTEKKTHSG
ncbi:hypothetical protein [Thiomicrospira sp. WB1]|uniref:hypothetical protein n=1 Tax=Thiomicrospira sp. WB1 TaxID=1685380 RepID=UPI0007487364|nr:hypothetical protein [Thiomicrospira sp. WB1]KUJ71542.1 hypothetical protein AVO41_08480 [Thiomicrospira sp. WB1]